MINFKFLSNNIMAQDKALYKGHAVAAVAAVNSHLAEEALSQIEVEYEVLPPVMRAQEAMADDATLNPRTAGRFQHRVHPRRRRPRRR